MAEEEGADIVVMLSSELIEKIAEAHFNKVMFKQRTEIVDSKPNDQGGYAFSIRFAPLTSKAVKDVSIVPEPTEFVKVGDVMIGENGTHTDVRDNKGRFVKR